jgi:hypothetical protein
MSGLGLRMLSGVLRAPGASLLRRALSAQVVDAELAAIDFAAEGDPAPYYMPPPYVRPTPARPLGQPASQRSESVRPPPTAKPQELSRDDVAAPATGADREGARGPA